jgi:hypothetical protein
MASWKDLTVAIRAPFYRRFLRMNVADTGADYAWDNNFALKYRNAADTADVEALRVRTDNNVSLAGGRVLVNLTAKALTDAATNLFDVACASGEMVGGVLHYMIRASSGSAHQVLVGTVTYAAVNTGGTVTVTVVNTTAPEAKAAPSGTLTTTWAGVAGTGKATVRVTPAGSLTETTYDVVYTLFPMRGAVTIL